MRKKEIVNSLFNNLNAVPKIIYESIMYGSWTKALLIPYTQEETEKNGVKSISKERLDKLAITITEEECHYGINNLIDYIEREAKTCIDKNSNIQGFIVKGITK